jgi:hypothetical protein
MVWAGSVVMVVSMVVAFLVSGAIGAGPMARMLIAETRAGAPARPEVALAR